MTLDAAALCKMADRGQIRGGILDGPLAFDNAVSMKAAEIEHIVSPVAGQADVLVVLGARVPIVLTSRSDSANAHLASCAVMALMVHARRSAGPGGTEGASG